MVKFFDEPELFHLKNRYTQDKTQLFLLHFSNNWEDRKEQVHPRKPQ